MRVTWFAPPETRAKSSLGLPISTPWLIRISVSHGMRPWRARCNARGPAAEPVAGSSSIPSAGANMRVFQARPEPEKTLNPISGIAGERAQGGEVGSERGDVIRPLQHHIDVLEPVVIDGHRQHRLIGAESSQEL